MAKMNSKWVILCSAAIGAIYTAGYFTTDTLAAIQQPVPYSQVSGSSGNQGSKLDSQPAGSQVSVNVSQPTSKPASTKVKPKTATPTPAPTVKSKYINGTFYGAGNNRRGSVQVAVSIKNDKITGVEISDYRMRYSQDYIAGLPQEIIQNQSAKVHNVSGATYSTRAFRDAIQNALDQALNA
ncbi:MULTISPECIES: FMN-binding protein [unclassified Paenibacillus]|uniref:FMN-binding protein n=1 Tax=unclassified Paenibacillus TaxID=185978 RepID=UPI00093A4298|nr:MULTISPECIES: FMN-binding protein [unclassified Paenibacillus]OKP94488.1 hypothetical protein A3848_00420 [Paenibacillus sp. P32E]OKP98871.1 hypothetical protein A3849_07930 [Paenibacillus sp. P46E]